MVIRHRICALNYVLIHKKNFWSGQRDSNPRPSAPKADALPGCAMPRFDLISIKIGYYTDIYIKSDTF